MNPALAANALEEAGRIIDDTGESIDHIINYLKNKTIADVFELADEPWFQSLKTAVYTFRTRYAKVVYKYELGVYDDSGDKFTDLMRIASALQEFQLRNSVQDAGSSSVTGF